MTKKIYLETFKKCPGSLCFTLLEHLYTSQDQCIVKHSLCRSINALVKTSVLQALLFLGILIH